jgi:hypothetical protein
MTDTERYNEAINSMALEYEHEGEMPSKYCDEFVNCAAENLRKEKDWIKTKGILIFDAIITGDRKNGKIIDMIADYMQKEDDVLKKVIAISICELMADNIINYYKEDIEDEIKDKFKKINTDWNYSIYNSGEMLPHCG